MICVYGLPSVVGLDVPFVVGISARASCLGIFMFPLYPFGGLFGCSYAPCLTIHWSRSAFESVMVPLLEFSVILGRRVKVFVAGWVFSCSWLDIIGSVVLSYFEVFRNFSESGWPRSVVCLSEVGEVCLFGTCCFVLWWDVSSGFSVSG